MEKFKTLQGLLSPSWGCRGCGWVTVVVAAPGIQSRHEMRGLARASVGVSAPSRFWHVIWGVVPGCVWPLGLVLWLSRRIHDTLNSL